MDIFRTSDLIFFNFGALTIFLRYITLHFYASANVVARDAMYLGCLCVCLSVCAFRALLTVS